MREFSVTPKAVRRECGNDERGIGSLMSTSGSNPQHTAQLVRRLIAARAARNEFFSSDLFADPGWDILLELYALACEQRRTSVSKLRYSTGVPDTTALRWIDRLTAGGLIERRPDPLDARRVWVELSAAAIEAMNRYFQHLGASLII